MQTKHWKALKQQRQKRLLKLVAVRRADIGEHRRGIAPGRAGVCWACFNGFEVGGVRESFRERADFNFYSSEGAIDLIFSTSSRTLSLKQRPCPPWMVYLLEF